RPCRWLACSSGPGPRPGASTGRASGRARCSDDFFRGAARRPGSRKPGRDDTRAGPAPLPVLARQTKGNAMVGQLHPRLTEPVIEMPLDTKGFARPRALLDRIDEDLPPLLDLALRPVISAQQFTRPQLTQRSRLAARFETQPQLLSRPLTGKILIS